MKKTQKRVFGMLGLCLVAGMTILAATLPAPGASAVTSSITDTLQIRVVGSVPDVSLDGIEQDELIANPLQSVTVTYENVDAYTVSITRTDEDGNEETHEVTTATPNYYPGVSDPIDINLDDYGFGEYRLAVLANGFDAEQDEDFIEFTYIPLIASVEQDDKDGLIHVDIDTVTDQVDKIQILVDGKPVGEYPKSQFGNIPGIDPGLTESGKVTITIVSYDADGNQLYLRYDIEVNFKVTPTSPTGKPDTGGLFQNVEISKVDYLTTGLIVFFIIGVVAIGVVASNRSHKTTKSTKTGRKR